MKGHPEIIEKLNEILTCELTSANKIVATASGIWKILKLSGAGPGS